MGLLTLIRRKRRPCYRVRVHGLGRYSEERFGSLFEAREYADHLASISDVVCLIYLDKGTKPVYCTDDDWGGDEGSSGVREPRRPMPDPRRARSRSSCRTAHGARRMTRRTAHRRALSIDQGD